MSTVNVIGDMITSTKEVKNDKESMVLIYYYFNYYCMNGKFSVLKLIYADQSTRTFDEAFTGQP